ncbi:Integral membrane sensor signal transduction histidine kinase [Candidatus Sulfopaludibacter sp. SbA4]|nr:Integral membrane sensor signal transduction histidine kinase [Candidatus Sulfopaludibacter sp. SbA4]
MTGRIFLKLIAGVFCVLLLALVTVDYTASEVARDANIQNLIQQVAEKGRMLAVSAPDPAALGVEQARKMASAAGGRITVVRSDGKVLVDSEADAARMENHRTPDRAELVKAFGGEVGWKIRHSATIGIDFLYVAVPIAGGAIRIAVPLSEIERQAARVRVKILGSTALAFLPAIAIAAVFSRWISRRFAAIMAHAGELARGNFRARLARPGKSEFGQLGETLNELSENLQRTVEQLQREHAELERVERVRKDFVINVSHELRTPLASIQGYTETLIDGALSDPQYNMRFLQIIRHNAERLARITEDLLTLSRIEQRRQKFEFEPHLVNGLLHEAVESIRPIAAKSHLQLDLEPAPADSEAWCDSEAVSQILSNLLDNAIKYTPEGGRITVGAQPAGRFMEVYVRDTGIGIPPEEQPRLFERFYRVDKARSRELGGTGLGLSIVKHLVAAHHGSTRVESRLNQGSTFYFTLPADESALGEEQLNPEFTAP